MKTTASDARLWAMAAQLLAAEAAGDTQSLLELIRRAHALAPEDRARLVAVVDLRQLPTPCPQPEGP